MTAVTFSGTNLAPSLPQPSIPKRLEGKDVGIPVRRMNLPFSDLPKFWFGGNAFLTAFFAGFSSSLPIGEGQFIHSVRQFQSKITDPVLLAQVRAFSGQEGHHSAAHDAFNKAIVATGFPTDRADAKKAASIKWLRKKIAPEQQLANTVCSEHMTALLSDLLLSKCPDLLEEMSPQARQIWAWHCIEEAEHKSVAFDVYMQVVGDRRKLRRTMRLMTVVFFLANGIGALSLMKGTGQVTNWKMWREALSKIRRMLRVSKAEYSDFYKEDFHPWHHDNTAVLKEARRKYLGE